MIFKNKKFKYIISFLVVLCSLCAFFAVSASAECVEGDGDGVYTAMIDFNPPSCDYSSVNEHLEGWSEFTNCFIDSFGNCSVDLVYYKGNWCLRVIPIDIYEDAVIDFVFDRVIFNVADNFRGHCFAFESVGADGVGFCVDLSQKFYNGDGTLFQSAEYSEEFYIDGVYYYDYVNSASGYTCDTYYTDGLSVSFSALCEGQAIYIRGFGFGVKQTPLSKENAHTQLAFSENDSNVLPVFVRDSSYSHRGYVKMFDFKNYGVNLCDIYEQSFFLADELGLLREELDVRLFFTDLYNKSDIILIHNPTENASDTYYFANTVACLYDYLGDSYQTFRGRSVNFGGISYSFPSYTEYLLNTKKLKVMSVGLVFRRQEIFQIGQDDNWQTDLMLYRVRLDSRWTKLWLDYYNSLGYASGYNNGMIDGIDVGYENALMGQDELLNEKYNEGYNLGYGTGLEKGRERGYLDGWDEGYENGKIDGFVDGQEQGLDVAYDNGYREGTTDGYNEGYQKGTSDGYQKGTSDGYKTGYDSGVNESASVWEDKVDEAFSKGYADGYNIGFANGDDYEGQNFNDLIITATKSISSFVVGLLDWNILGVNILSFIGGILLLGLCIPIIKTFKR